MTSSIPYCGICDLRYLTKPSVVWCSECDEGLCDDCREHHSLSKATRKHGTIPIADYNTLPSHVLDIKEYCSEHEERFEIFCKKHECPCCRRCVLIDHTKCEDLIGIESVTKNVKTSDIFIETEQLIAEILNIIGQIRQDRKSNCISIEDQRKMVEIEIQEARKKLNYQLDQLQERLLEELAKAEEKTLAKIREIQVSLDEHEKQLVGFQENMASIKQYASDLQTFLSIRQIEREAATIDTSVMSLLTNESMRTTIIKCKIDTFVQNCSTSILKFGTITSRSQPSELTIVRKKDKQAQIMAITSPTITVENVLLKSKQTIKTESQNTRGCALLSDGSMFFSCYVQNRVISFNKDGSKVFDTGNLLTHAFDIAYIENTSALAVSSGSYNDSGIVLIDAKSGEKRKTIELHSYSYGLVYRHNTLINCGGFYGLHMVKLRDDSVKKLIAKNMCWGGYISSFGDKLYYTDNEANTVTCCDLKGNTQWEFQDTNILVRPLGITVDNDGNVYVVGEGTSNVIVISPDGKRHKQLLFKRNGLLRPRVLDFERSRNELLVANAERIAFLFQVCKNQ